MSRFRQITAAVIVTVAGATALLGQSASAATTQTAAVKLASVKISGSKHAVLVNSSGRAVYLLTGDSISHPTCTDADCLGNWPPVTTTSAKPTLGAGIKGKLTIWKHRHLHQLALNGHPLYTFAGDSSVGTANGQGLKSDGGVWELLTSSGAGMTTGSKSSSSSSSSGGGW